MWCLASSTKTWSAAHAAHVRIVVPPHYHTGRYGHNNATSRSLCQLQNGSYWRNFNIHTIDGRWNSILSIPRSLVFIIVVIVYLSKQRRYDKWGGRVVSPSLWSVDVKLEAPVPGNHNDQSVLWRRILSRNTILNRSQNCYTMLLFCQNYHFGIRITHYYEINIKIVFVLRFFSLNILVNCDSFHSLWIWRRS